MTRQEIKDFVAATLIAAMPEVGGRVYTNRVRELDEKKLPCIHIRTQRETGTKFNEAPIGYERTYSLAVICICREDDNVDTELDALSQKVENTLINIHVMNLLEGMNQVDWVSTDLNIQMAESEIGGALVLFNFVYDTRHEPEIEDGATTIDKITDLNGVDIELTSSTSPDKILYSDKIDFPDT